MTGLWSSQELQAWREALDRYPAVVERQGVDGLADHDRWVREELPTAIAGRDPRHVRHDELVRVTRWKMARGVWRARNLVLVQGNSAEEVREASRQALSKIPDARAPVAALTKLAGVGPATASAVLAAAAPEHYPFFDDLVAGPVPGLGEVSYTPGFYQRYADALRDRAAALGGGWTPVDVERALWSNAGGKAAQR